MKTKAIENVTMALALSMCIMVWFITSPTESEIPAAARKVSPPPPALPKHQVHWDRPMSPELWERVTSFWTFDADEKRIRRDCGPHELHLRATGGTVPGAEAGIDGASVDFTRASGYLSRAAHEKHHSGGEQDYSLQVWLYLTPGMMQDMWICSKWHPDPEWNLCYDSTTQKLVFSWCDGLHHTWVESIASIAAGEWYCVHAGHRYGKGIWLRINGGAEAFVPHTTGGNRLAGDLVVGMSPYEDGRFCGFMDLLAIWQGYALTDPDCRELYNHGLGVWPRSSGSGSFDNWDYLSSAGFRCTTLERLNLQALGKLPHSPEQARGNVLMADLPLD